MNGQQIGPTDPAYNIAKPAIVTNPRLAAREPSRVARSHNSRKCCSIAVR